MDYNQDIFFKMQQQQMPGKQPFYMTNPIQNLYMTELEYQRDLDRMKEMYPMEIRKVQELVEEECDKMEYEGSLMFDVFPDKIALQLMAAGIAGEFTKKYPDSYPEEGRLLRDMIEVVLYHEIMYRRNRYRNHKRLYL